MTAQPEKQLTKREEQAQKSREAILDATIKCLDKYGYAETSTSRITEVAGVSRGALTHHFASKEDLIVETTNKILRPTVSMRPMQSAKDGSVSDDLAYLWNKVANTRPMRALVEILIACRTDKKLRDRLKPDLVSWNRQISEYQASRYAPKDGDEARLELQLTIMRVFFRGLITHDSFVANGDDHAALVSEFFNMLEPLITRRE